MSAQTAGTVAVPGTIMSSAPPSSVASWFCRVLAAEKMDTLPAAPPARPKDELRARHRLLLSTKRSASVPMDVPESPRMFSDRHEQYCVSRDITY